MSGPSGTERGSVTRSTPENRDALALPHAPVVTQCCGSQTRAPLRTAWLAVLAGGTDKMRPNGGGFLNLKIVFSQCSK